MWYGGRAGAAGPNATCSLATPSGNVFSWRLCEVQDTVGNFFSVQYSQVTVPDWEDAPQLYTSSITWTGFAGVEGPYRVAFTNDSEGTQRQDVPHPCRQGACPCQWAGR